MHPRDEAPEAPAVLVAADVVAGLVPVAAGALDVLLPHAASSRLVAAAAAVAIKAVVCLTVSSTGLKLSEPRRHGATP
jgi:hypothetical protein